MWNEGLTRSTGCKLPAMRQHRGDCPRSGTNMSIKDSFSPRDAAQASPFSDMIRMEPVVALQVRRNLAATLRHWKLYRKTRRPSGALANGFARTSPARAFTANSYGFYDKACYVPEYPRGATMEQATILATAPASRARYGRRFASLCTKLLPALSPSHAPRGGYRHEHEPRRLQMHRPRTIASLLFLRARRLLCRISGAHRSETATVHSA